MSDQGSQGLFSPFLRAQRLKAALPWISGRVLDVGCGAGMLAAHLKSEDYVGFDIDPLVLLEAQKANPRHSFTSEFPSSGTFDSIVALAVIEHVPNPPETMREWANRLRPDGRIVLTTPHRSMRLLHEAGATAGLFSTEAADEHEVMFTKSTLENLLAGTGLQLHLYRRFLFGANQLVIATKA